ncbi:MAG: toll/interleukin-1 receptor domain-containing protein [Chloroflexi bacterium]|nr:toll/interleukin-1 receptor domain-containing protein [Chloroflexota bacterium]
MAPNIFMSYSRQCIGFVDDLAHQLQKRGFPIWLDYLSLVPGRPWLEQIHNGLAEADLLLLVVSPESMSSRSVELEWRHFLEQKKRIILLIFQAVPLPPELAGLEWVDFRGGYPPALKKLLARIASASPMKRPAPQSGFKAPLAVWFATGLSLITAVYSLFAFWTFLIPWVLLPLPGRIFKRNFNLSQTQTALWTLTIALFFTFGLSMELGFYKPETDFDYVHVFSLYNAILMILFLQIYFIPLISILLLFVLRSSAMQRWGRPEAGLPKFANIHHPNIPDPEPVRFYIDHAAQDALIARDLAQELVKYGHTPADGLASAGEVLVLLSRFKTDTEADPEKQVVYPILVQRTKISDKLSRMQWIDFRKGVRNLEAIAQLLPQPAKMLAALGVRPTTGAQAAMPNIVLVLLDYLIIIGMVGLGAFLSYLLELAHLNIGLLFERELAAVLRVLSLQSLCVALSGGLIWLMVRDLGERRGWFASPIKFLMGPFVLLALSLWQAVLGDQMAGLFLKYGILSETIFAGLPFLFVFFGGLIAGAASLLRLKTLRHWFPARVR